MLSFTLGGIIIMWGIAYFAGRCWLNLRIVNIMVFEAPNFRLISKLSEVGCDYMGPQKGKRKQKIVTSTTISVWLQVVSRFNRPKPAKYLRSVWMLNTKSYDSPPFPLHHLKKSQIMRDGGPELRNFEWQVQRCKHVVIPHHTWYHNDEWNTLTNLSSSFKVFDNLIIYRVNGRYCRKLETWYDMILYVSLTTEKNLHFHDVFHSIEKPVRKLRHLVFLHIPKNKKGYHR